ncbi:hypothetical protein TNCV_337071 [Trichonephila clavipes]|nr:hypothetical protein TNCV_337071 [Trichonephila clavipes]
MKLLDILEKSKSNRNEVIYPRYPVTRIPRHTNQFAHRQHFHHLPIITRPCLFSFRPCIRETNDYHNDQQFCNRMNQLSTPSKNTRKQYNNPTSSNMRTYDHAGRTN